MNKIIRGKRYDTETASELHHYQCGYIGDLNYVSETLYRKRTGEYFLYGEGGANTQYSIQTGTNSWSGGEEIIPITEKEAREWAEDVMDADKYEKIFGKVDENKKTVTSLSLSSADSEKIKKEAVKRKISVSELVSKLINNAERNGWDL